MEIESKFVNVGKIKTHYLEAGVGDQVVVLVHGGGLDNARLSWELLMPELSNAVRVIAPDLPGYGQSDKPDVLYDLSFYGKFFPEFIDALGIKQTALVGISMGGAISLGYSIHRPDRVSKLVLVDSYGLQRKTPFHKLSYLFVNIPGVRALTYWSIKSRPMISYSLKMILKRPGSVTDELVEKVFQQLLIPGVTRAFSDFQNAELTWDGLKTVYMDRLGEIMAKTLIIHGEKDTLVPLEASREAHGLIQGSEFKIMAGCGHWPQRDNPEEFNQVVREFLL
jgi:pimeloyl-ACP methyl ester carboxylesterase